MKRFLYLAETDTQAFVSFPSCPFFLLLATMIDRWYGCWRNQGIADTTPFEETSKDASLEAREQRSSARIIVISKKLRKFHRLRVVRRETRSRFSLAPSVTSRECRNGWRMRWTIPKASLPFLTPRIALIDSVQSPWRWRYGTYVRSHIRQRTCQRRPRDGVKIK